MDGPFEAGAVNIRENPQLGKKQVPILGRFIPDHGIIRLVFFLRKRAFKSKIFRISAGSKRSVGIQPQDVIPGSMPDGFVTGGGKILGPGKGKHLGTGFFGPGDGGIFRTCVHHDHFIDRRPYAGQAIGDIILFVFKRSCKAKGFWV